MASLPRPKPDKNGFVSRSPETSRLEGFSDAVFGFSLTLLVVALEVPKSFDGLMASLRGAGAFAFSFAMLYYVWNLHYLYCRRFGLESDLVRTLTGALLFVVVLYVYPLRFLATLFVGGVMGADRAGVGRLTIAPRQVPELFRVYGLGFCLIFALLGALYAVAYRERDRLEMGEVERFAVRAEAILMGIMAAVAFASILLTYALPVPFVSLAGFAYFAIAPLATLHGHWAGRRIRALQRAAEGRALP